MYYKSDYRTLIVLFITLACEYFSLTQILNISTALLFFPITILMFISLQINHNVMHVSIFRFSAINILVNLLLSVCTAFPVSLIYYPHIANHHPNACNEKDWSGYLIVENVVGLKRIFKYIVLANLMTAMRRPINIFQGLSVERKLSLTLESFLVVCIFIFELKFNALSFLLLYFLPSIIAMNTMVFMNFYLHDGCEYNSEKYNSKTFTGSIKNFLLFNNGYHQAHHLKPKMHWSKLPDYWHNKLDFPEKNRFEFNSFFKHFKSLYLQSHSKSIS